MTSSSRQPVPLDGRAATAARWSGLRRGPALLAVALLATSLLAHARSPDGAGDMPVQFTLQSMVTGVDPATGRDGSTYSVTTHAGAERVRMDLVMPGRPPATMVVDRISGEGWVFDPVRATGLPVQIDAVRELLVDPGAPCAQMRVTCHREPPRTLAGVTAQGWRYAGANRRGPGGSHAGTMWVDPASGIVLGYEARTRTRQPRRMRAASFKVEAVDGRLLELPAQARSP